jgi:hypothetical protein
MAARKFFYIAAGVFLFALAFHLGQTSARAQVGGLIDCAGTTNGEAATAVIGRYVYFMSRSEPVRLFASQPIPGTSRVVACEAPIVVLENGEVWFWYSVGGGEWSLVGTFPGGPTPTQQQSWGQLKSRYAPSHVPTSKTLTTK